MKEISRIVTECCVEITYDDGSVKTLSLDKQPQNIVVDADQDPNINKIHVMKDQ